MEVFGRQEKSVVAMEFTGCYAKPAVAFERLRLLWKVNSRYEESVRGMEVINHGKSVVAMEVAGCYANSLVALQSRRSLWRGYGCCGKSSDAMTSQWGLWKLLVARKSQWLLWKSVVAMQSQW
jgi:hypothetical protein